MQKEIEFICGERHEKSSKEGLVHNSRSDGSVGDSLHILFCEMGAEKFGSLLSVLGNDLYV